MRKSRLVFWIISLAICAIIIVAYKKEESKIPYEERTPINIYCMEEFQEDVKTIIEDDSIGQTHRVVFTDNKETAEFILTDKISKTDKGYERLGWTPLIIAFDDSAKGNLSSYEDEYMVINEKTANSYIINFEKIIEAVLEGKWSDKIYCPNPDTREGELFFDFLLININDGSYPRSQDEMEKCNKVANEFLNSSIVIQLNSTERLSTRKTVANELYIIFEKDIYNMGGEKYDFEISYPSNTVLYEYYYCYRGENKKELENLFEGKEWSTSLSKIQNVVNKHDIRNEVYNNGHSTMNYKVSSGFSYVEIPLKEE